MLTISPQQNNVIKIVRKQAQMIYRNEIVTNGNILMSTDK